jgi:tetratricopeptide (TPR) repeat protein
MSDFQAITTLIAEREIKKAEVQLARWLRTELSSHETQQALALRARLRLLAARPLEALEDLTAAHITAASSQADALELLGDCHLALFETALPGFSERSHAHQALMIYQRLVQDFPQYDNLGWISYQLGRTALILDHVTTAEEYFRAALFQPATVTALTAYCYERLGYIAFYEQRQPRQALTFLTKALHTYPTHEPRTWLIQVQLFRSRLLTNLHPEQALDTARQALKWASEENALKLSAEAQFLLGELLFQQGRQQEALSYLQRFLQMSKTPPGVDVTWSRLYEMLGDIYFALTRYEQAASAYENALHFNPYHPWEETLHYRISTCYFALRDYAQAIQQLGQWIRKAQAEDHTVQDHRFYQLLGDAHSALAQYELAAQAYRQALSLAPTTDAETLRLAYEQAIGRVQPL